MWRACSVGSPGPSRSVPWVVHRCIAVEGLILVLVSFGFLVITAAAALLGRAGGWATRVAIWAPTLVLPLGVAGALAALLGEGEADLRRPWSQPLGALILALDSLSAWSVLPVFVVGAIGGLHGPRLLAGEISPRRAAFATAAWNLLLASMILLLLARNGALFLIAWEGMSLIGWGLLSLHHEHADVRRSGLIYLVATHAGTAALLLLFLILYEQGGGALDLRAAAAGSPTLLISLALVGFGAKAGLFPLHVWLPGAHGNAPAHVSALFSGVVVKMGIYGLLRILQVVGASQPALSTTLIVLGLLTSGYGIAMALQERDAKRVLAYSTIENVGIIVLAIGVSCWGTTHGHSAVATLGMLAALMHVHAHAAAKSLLFLSFGTLVHAVGLRNIDKMGGLLKRMPWIGGAALLGAATLAGLPPFPAFGSEFLLYLGLAQGGLGTDGSAALGPLLALGGFAFIGALAVLTFIRLIGIALLGEPRSAAAQHVHPPTAGLTGPLVAMGAIVVALGVFTGPSAVGAGAVVRDVLRLPLPPEPLLAAQRIGLLHAGLIVAVLSVAWWLRRTMARRPSATGPTWDCGYAEPSATMQYTSASFAETARDQLIPVAIRHDVSVGPITGLFPAPPEVAVRFGDPVLERALLPTARALLAWLGRLSPGRGQTSTYIAYIALAVVIGLGWITSRGSAP